MDKAAHKKAARPWPRCWSPDFCAQVLRIDLEQARTALATAIALYGPGSGAALATVVGVLVEVPVMLSVCRVCIGSKRWYERGIPKSEPVPASLSTALNANEK